MSFGLSWMQRPPELAEKIHAADVETERLRAALDAIPEDEHGQWSETAPGMPRRLVGGSQRWHEAREAYLAASNRYFAAVGNTSISVPVSEMGALCQWMVDAGMLDTGSEPPPIVYPEGTVLGEDGLPENEEDYWDAFDEAVTAIHEDGRVPLYKLSYNSAFVVWPDEIRGSLAALERSGVEANGCGWFVQWMTEAAEHGGFRVC